MVSTPVLFQTFVRVDYARQVWESIKKAQPKKLYFYSNKGREDRPGEVDNNNKIREWINEVDWDCELHTWFREECVDVYTSLKGAVDWLFNNEEEGIILEDDIVPTQAFFSFCDQMVNRFRNEKNVWYCSGDNFYNLNPSGYDYIFSRYHWMYGWATWRDRWQKIRWDDFKINELLSSRLPYHLYESSEQARRRINQIKDFADFLKQTKDWDYAFGITIDQNLGFGVFPKEHLIHNIGISGVNHSQGEVSFVNIEPKVNSDHYLIKNEPPFVCCDFDFDYQYYKIKKRERYTLKNIIKSVIFRIKKIF